MAIARPGPEVRSITLAPHLAEVSRGRALLTEIASQAGFPEERVFDITVACSEAMANAIEHSPVKGEVQVRSILRRDRLEVEVQGPGEFQAPDRLKTRETRGLGLPLMAKLSDHLALFSGPNGETFVSLTFYRPGVQIRDEGAIAPTFTNLAEENRLLDEILKNFPDAFFVLDHERRFVYLNPEALDRVNRSLDDLIGRDVWEVFPDFAPTLRQAFEAAETERSVRQVTAATPDDHWREWTAFPVEDGLAIWARDITERKQAEAELRTSRTTFAELIERLPFGTYIVDSQFRIAFMNAGSQSGAFRNVRPLIGRPFNEAMHTLWPDDVAEDIISHFRHTLETGEPYYSPRFTNPRHDVDMVESYEWELQPIALPDGQRGVICYYFDSTELRTAEAALRRQARLLDLSSDAIFAWDLDGAITYWNQGAERLYGFTAEEAIGQVSHELLKTVHPHGFASFRAALEQDAEWLGEVTHTAKNGRVLVVETRQQLIQTGDRRLVLETTRDITERKQAEQERERLLADQQALNEELAAANEELAASGEELAAQTEELIDGERQLRESEERFRLVLDSSLDGIYRVNLQSGRYEYMSPAFGPTVGRSNDEFLQLSPREAMLLVHPDDLPKTAAALGAAEAGHPVMVEYRLLGSDGEYRWIANHFSQTSDAEGRPFFRDGAVRDITEQKRAQEAIAATNEQLTQTLENVEELSYSLDYEWKFLWISETAAARYGKKRVDIIGRNIWEMFPALIGTTFEEDYRAAMEQREIRRFEAPGTITGVWYHVSVFPSPPGITVFGMDITESKRAAEALRESDANFRSLFGGSPDAIFMAIAGGPIMAANPAACAMFEMTEEELCAAGRPGIEDPDDPAPPAALRERALSGKVRYEATHVRKSGLRFPSEVTSVLVEGGTRSIVIIRDITPRRLAEEELREREGRSAFLLELTDALRPIVDPVGVQETASRLLGEFLKADRVTYFEVRGDDYIVERDYAPSVPHLSGRYPIAAFGERLLATYRAGRMVVSNNIAGDPIPPQERDSFFSIQVHAQISVPLIKNDEFVAGLAVHSATPRTWKPQEMRLVEDVAERTWAAVERGRAEAALEESEERYRALAEENERLYRQQLDIAENLQAAFLHIPSQLGPVRLGHLYRSATEAARVGGDFYDVFQVKEGKIAVLIGDVSGHGIQAARAATLVKDVVHAFIHQTLRTNEVLKRTSNLLIEKGLSGYVTLFLGILDTETGELQYSSAGHPDMLIRRASGEIERLGVGSSPLGIYADAVWKPSAVEMQADDLLVLFTDGVIEGRRNGELFGEKRLEVLIKSKRVPAERLPEVILDQVLTFSEGVLQDDLAILTLRLTTKADAAASKKKSSTWEKPRG